MSWALVFNIDCRKVETYQHSPDVAAELLRTLVTEGDELVIGTICLGKIKQVIVDGPIIRIYVTPDPSIELGSAYFPGGN